MTILRITPTETTELLAPSPREPHANPGDLLAGHLHAPRRGQNAPALTRGEGPILSLSEPIPADQLDAGTPYVVQDSQGRVLSVQDGGSGAWQWAFFGAYNSYWTDVFPLQFSANPVSTPSSITMLEHTWPLHSNGTATSWEYAFWAPSDYGTGYPVMSFTAKAAQTNADGAQTYTLSWNNKGTTMALCSDSGSWNWAYVSSSHTAAALTFHKFYVQQKKLNSLFSDAWPDASYDLKLNTGDLYYQAVTTAQAMSTYQNSGLAQYSWKANYFDCDDFSYVYKAQSSKDAYAVSPEYGYAVGIIFGTTKNSAHAVNVFIDTSGTVQVIEPQNGQICQGKDWKDSTGAGYSPYFILM